MFITIGEIVNVLLEYSNSIKMDIVQGMPFVVAQLGNKIGLTRAYVYIVQTGEHQYSVCDYYDDLSGNRYFYTGTKDDPFIQEKDIIQMKYNFKSPQVGDYSSVMKDLNTEAFFDHLYTLLSRYEIIQIDSKIFPERLNSFFRNPRIKRNIDSGLHEAGCSNGTVISFIKHAIKDKKRFNLGNLKSREIKEVVSGLKTIGVIPVMDGNWITGAYLERHK